MAAPSTTVWGNIVTESTSAAKIGIYIALSGTNATSTSVTATIQVWIASKWSLLDSDYSFYFNNGATSASTLISDDELPKIDFKVATGASWNDANQGMLYEYTVTYDRGASDKVINCAAKLKDINRFSGQTMTVSTSYTIPALSAYTVSYNANGGSGAPSAQTKYRGISLELSTTKPTRTGYAFSKWTTTLSDGTVATYNPGDFFGHNESVTLSAVWTAKEYTVTYNANGGSGAPSSQQKTHGTTLTLSTTKPTLTGYTFKGWGTSASTTTVAYSAGGSYTNNAAITLYAVWELAYTKPRIENLTVVRCTSNGTSSDDGTYFHITFNWSTDNTATSVKVAWGSTSTNVASGNTSGSVNEVLGAGAVSTENSYTITVTVTDSGGYTAVKKTLSGKAYAIDFLAGGKGVAIGKPATVANRFDIGMDTYVNGVKVTGNTLSTKATNTIANTDDDTPANWVNHGTSIHYYNVTSQLTDQPNQHAFLFNVGSGSNVHQIWMSQPNGIIYHRGGNANGWGSNSWREMLDDVNYTDHCLSLTGGTVNGYTKFNNGVNTMGWFRLHNEWIGFYHSVADAQAHTNRKAYISMSTDDNFYVQNSAGGSYIVSKAWTVSSDERLKTDVYDVSDALVYVWKELLPKTFKWVDPNSGDKIYLGLIAQDVITAFEKYGLDYNDYAFVTPYKTIDDDIEYFGITYDSYHMLTAMVLRETITKLEDQQEEIDSLKQQFEDLRRSLYGNEENAD